MKNSFRAVLVDDERLARNKLRSLLARHPEIQIVGEADSVRNALETIESLRPEVVFLDIQMPGESGFDLLYKADASFKVVFVTAFDEYAIRAFEVNALDYLLKPVNPDRLARAIERLSSPAGQGEKPERALEYDDHLFLSIDERSRFLKISTIECISAAGPYSEILTSDKKKAMVLKPLKEWEARLPEKYFTRIHRSTIINIEYVERVEKSFNYSYQVYLRGIKEPFVMSRRYASKLKGKLK
ncbi:MAG: LytTR family DNA-binding domain-containing protein [Blastocatellia bacterium]|nr:LytTR family DNA-binding domain-containing protein [Blastocatellia bacterium]